MKYIILALHLYCLLEMAATTVLNTDHRIANTTSGLFQGHPVLHRPDVLEYLGIPFAQPPLGELRFEAPRQFEDVSSKVVQAKHFSPSCPQNITAIKSFPGVLPDGLRILNINAGVGQNVSEDCLYLNIWTKKRTVSAKRPILVFVYGGAFAGGFCDNAVYHGQAFAEEENVVVVTFNYRLNVFGFLGLPGYEQNVGLLDLRAAVEWVRDNADAFGGDPSRIIIAGQSAGSALVDLYSYAWAKDPIVSGIIAQSGTATSFGIPPHNNTASWYKLSASLGCGDVGTELRKTVECVKKIRSEKVTAAVPLSGTFTSAFSPTSDGMVVFDDYFARASQGNFIQKPYLYGNNNNEEAYFNATMGGLLTIADGNAVNNRLFTCPIANATAIRADHGVTAYRYRYFGEFRNLRLYATSGSYHGAELPILFGTAKPYSSSNNTRLENRWSKIMRGLWSDFARNPSNLTAAGLLRYDPRGKTLNILATGRNTKITYNSSTAYDSECP